MSPLFNALGSAEFPEGTPYAWVAAEAGLVKSIPTLERRLTREVITIGGYRKVGASIEDERRRP